MQVITASQYPILLTQAATGYAKLWVEGSVAALDTPCISIVGTRKITGYGQGVIEHLVPGLVRAGLTVVSGLALGVDAYAQRVALESGGRCVAVLGSGLHQVYPASNRRLAEEIIQKGALVSAYEPTVTARKHHFPERNRIIAALSLVTLVIEAAADSGSLITARAAVQMNRDVAAVPGDIMRESSHGCITLIQDGAKPIRCVEDIIQLYQQTLPLQIVDNLKPALTGTMATLYATISNGVQRVDEMLRHTGLPLTSVQNALSLLEIEGYICQRQQQWHAIS